MFLKRGLLFSAVFLIVLIASFPYDAYLHSRLTNAFPGIKIGRLHVSPWSGIEAGNIEIPQAGQRVEIETARIGIGGLFPPSVNAELSNRGGRIRVSASGSRQRPAFVLTADHMEDFIPPASARSWPMINLRGTGTVDPKTFTLLDGTHLEITASGEMELPSNWSLLIGANVQEGGMIVDVHDNSLHLGNIHFKTERIQFKGSGRIHPSMPIQTATLILQGEAVTGGQTLSVDKSISLSTLFFPSLNFSPYVH